MQAKSGAGSSRILMIVSMLIFGSVGIFRRLIPLPSSVLACYRGLAGSLFLLIFMAVTKKRFRHNIGCKKVLGLILTGAGIGLNWMLLFEAYNYTTVATATLCYYMQPIIVILLSPLIFREKLTWKKGLCVLVAMIGMFLVSGLLRSGEAAPNSGKGILFGLGAACLYAAVVITNKCLPGIDAYEKTTIQLFSAAVVLLPYILLKENVSSVSLDATAVVMLVIIGLVHTGAAYAMYFGSMEALPIQSVAIISYLDPITAMILSAVILQEAMTFYEVVGAVLILGATAVSEFSGKD